MGLPQPGPGCVIQADLPSKNALTATLARAADLVKFYGCELGAQTKFDKKTGTSIVNGAHDTSASCVELLEVRGMQVGTPTSCVL